MMVLKDTLLSLADNPRMRKFVVENKLTRNVSRRFVAGEVLDDAIQATRMMNHQQIQTALDLLGENVSDAYEAKIATQNYIDAINLVERTRIGANISTKLTALGLDISKELCEENLSLILERAQVAGVFVCVDMEGSPYTERTIAVTLQAHERFEQVGTVVQSYLYRTKEDLERLIVQNVRVRLVKGAYKEASNIAFQQKSEVDRSYVELMKMLLARGNFPAIATHDQVMIEAACAYVRDHGIAKNSFEFQMLYGIRRDLQERLVKEGYNVRVYVPYGSQWYPYLMRRMAERPANLVFVVSNMWR